MSSAHPVHFCRVCGEEGHRSRQCPNLESEDESLEHLRQAMEMDNQSLRSWGEPQGRAASNASMASFYQVEKSSPKKAPKAKAKSEVYQLDHDEQEHITMEDLTEHERAKIAKARARAQKTRQKREQTKALTGQLADYPTLSHSYSEEVPFNMIGCFRSRMVVYMWKKLFWQIRVKERGGENYARGQVEEESEVAGSLAGDGGGILVGTLRSPPSEAPRPSGPPIDVSPDWNSSGDDVVVEEHEGKDYESEGHEEKGFSPPSNEEDDYEGVGTDVRDQIYAKEELYVDEEDLSGIYEEDREIFYQERQRPMKWTMGRPARGLTQKMKKGVGEGIRRLERLNRGAQVTEKFMVLEIFSGSSMLTLVANEMDGWGAYQPVDVILNEEGDMSQKANRDKVKSMVRVMKPDLVVITPPCGPWCAWQRTCRDWDALDEIRKDHLPFWKMAREVWDIQAEGVYVSLNNPRARRPWRRST